jgi:adenosine deaminase
VCRRWCECVVTPCFGAAAGIPVTLNADNLLMSGTAELESVPTQEYARAVSMCGVSVPHIRTMLENSIAAAFNPKAMTDEWKKAFFLEADAVIAAYQSETE